MPSQPPDDAMSSSSMSLRDTMRQRYSVTWHPRLPCLIVSDGYMVTALNMSSRPTSSSLMGSFLMETTQALERVRKLVHSELVSPLFRQLVLCFGWKNVFVYSCICVLVQPQMRSRLESMSTLKFTGSLLVLKERETPEITLPLFLRGGGGMSSSKLMTGMVILLLTCLLL